MQLNSNILFQQSKDKEISLSNIKLVDIFTYMAYKLKKDYFPIHQF